MKLYDQWPRPRKHDFFDMVFYKLYTVFLEYNHHESGIWLDKI